MFCAAEVAAELVQFAQPEVDEATFIGITPQIAEMFHLDKCLVVFRIVEGLFLRRSNTCARVIAWSVTSDLLRVHFNGVSDPFSV